MTAIRERTGDRNDFSPSHAAPVDHRIVRTRAEAEAYVASVCFKHGPPKLLGIELEWTVHDEHDPRAALDTARLIAALGPHAPTTLVENSPATALPGGCTVTVEPGGQVEISSPARASAADLLSLVTADAEVLRALLASVGLSLGEYGVDAYRTPRRVLGTPRYCAMEEAFDTLGPDGRAMMCSTAGVQVCVDAGDTERVGARWAAAHALGPVMVALFGNTAKDSVTRTQWHSARQRIVFGSDPVRMRPAPVTTHPELAWAARVLDAPVMCRRGATSWSPDRPMSFAQWIDGGYGAPPTCADLDLHMSTMFPPVRPHGYLEIRYLDAQPGQDWAPAAALLIGLFARESTVDSVLELAAPVQRRWLSAARYGLADPHLRCVARSIVELGVEALTHTDLSASAIEEFSTALTARV